VTSRISIASQTYSQILQAVSPFYPMDWVVRPLLARSRIDGAEIMLPFKILPWKSILEMIPQELPKRIRKRVQRVLPDPNKSYHGYLILSHPVVNQGTLRMSFSLGVVDRILKGGVVRTFLWVVRRIKPIPLRIKGWRNPRLMITWDGLLSYLDENPDQLWIVGTSANSLLHQLADAPIRIAGITLRDGIEIRFA